MTEDPKRSYKRLTPAIWAEIRALWEMGETTLAELADRYGVRTRTLQAHFAKHGTEKAAKAKELAVAVQAEIYSAMTFDAETRVELGKKAQAAAYRNALTIERLVMAQLEEAQKAPENAFKAATAIKTLSLAAQALERLIGIKKSALGLDQLPPSQEMFPVLQICDLSHAEIDRMQKAHEEGEDGPDEGCEPKPEDDEDAQIESAGGRLVRSNFVGSQSFTKFARAKS